MKLLDSQIRPRASGLPGGASSFPVENTATCGRGRASTATWPAAASSPSGAGPSLLPAASSGSPGTASPPARRIAAPGVTAALIATRAVPPSVSSTGTTASAPAGSGAPVVIRRQLPGASSCSRVSPAVTSPVTGRSTGESAVAAATSAARTA